MKVGYQILADLQQQQAFKQWGINTGGAVRTSTLPIPFTNVFLAVASTSSEWCCPGCSATNTTVTTRAYQSNRPDVAQPNDVNWIIIGCQPQWGKILGDTVNLKIINFPVSFNECFGGLALFNGDPVAAAEYATITDITNTNFKIYMYANNAGTGYANANIFYLFLGAQQQWGFIARNANTTFTFPIMFTTLYAAMRTAYGVSGRDPSWDEIAIPSATIKQINLGSCYWASYVIAIGI